jgi:prefoldin subunit 5
MEEVLRTHLQMRENELKMYSPPPLIPENKNKIFIDSDIDIDNITIDLGDEPKIKKSVSWEDNDIELLKKQIRELIKKTEKMQEEIDVLKYKRDFLETTKKPEISETIDK